MSEYLKDLRKLVGNMPILLCGASVIVENDKGEILLQLRSDNNCWGYPGGFVDINEAVEDAAKRELLEETGLVANSLELFGGFSGKELYYVYPNDDRVSNVDIVYICRDFSGEAAADLDECSDAKFFPIDELPKNISPPDVPALAKFCQNTAIQKEIDHYTSLPVIFDGFIEVPELSDGEIFLVCVKKTPGEPERNWLPYYEFAICKDGEKVGDISLRIGYGGGPKNCNCYYGGQIGFCIIEKFRGNGYAARACKLLWPVAIAHGMAKLLITNDVANIASRRVCEKLGARFLRLAPLPAWHSAYKTGSRFFNIFEWEL